MKKKELIKNLKNIVKIFHELEPETIADHLDYISSFKNGENIERYDSFFEQYIKPISQAIKYNDLQTHIDEARYLLEQYNNNVHITIEDYLKTNFIDFDLPTVYKECGMSFNGQYSKSDYIVCNESTILTYKNYYDRYDTFAVCCIYTKPEKRNNGRCKNLLMSLNFYGSLYFDTYSDALIKVVHDLGGYEEDVIKNKPSTQLILDVVEKW